MKKFLLWIFNFALIPSIGLCADLSTEGQIELHAHLFMKEGMGLVFEGEFSEPLKATSWKDKFKSQANPTTLKESRLEIVVVSLYAHPLFVGSLKNSIRTQIDLLMQWIETNPEWMLAKNPTEARKAIAAGKRIFILALEGASGILETEEDFKEFIDQKGIRIVTLLHLTDDQYGGVAFLKGFKALASPIAFIESLFAPEFDSLGVRVNSHGLSENGLKLAESLIRRKVWIDLAHASDKSQQDLLPILSHSKQPHLYTHTVMRKYLKAERGITQEQLDQVKATRGFVGLMPSEEMLETEPPGPCKNGLQALAMQFREVSERIGEERVTFGSDFNGGISHLPPSCSTGTSLDREGFWNIGQVPELWKALEKVGALKTPPTPSHQRIHTFLSSWASLWGTP